jgi:arginyl-tRNA synthetase
VKLSRLRAFTGDEVHEPYYMNDKRVQIYKGVQIY